MAWFWWDDFDRRMCGKWQSEKFQINNNDVTIFLSIEFENNEKGVSVNFSYNDASCSNPAFYVESSCNSLYLFHNDREHRAEYILTLKNENVDLMKCTFSIKNCFGLNGRMEKDTLEFARISEPLSEEDVKKYKVNYVEPKDISKIEILREYAEYGEIKSDVKFEFKFDERENVLDIIEKYNLDDLVKGKSDIETAITLMHWFCKRYRHGNPPGGLSITRTPQSLMEFADKNEGRTNCRGLALILAQIIRAYNIKAFHITCYPYEQPFNDCHVVVCVYCESLGKYIMLDPSANLYLKNKAGEIIGVEEFRNILIAGGELFPNEENTNWGNEGSMDNLDEYRNYMAKNLIRIERYNVSCYGNDGQGGHVLLIPEKYMQHEAKNFDDAKQKEFITSAECFWQI